MEKKYEVQRGTHINTVWLAQRWTPVFCTLGHKPGNIVQGKTPQNKMKLDLMASLIQLGMGGGSHRQEQRHRWRAVEKQRGHWWEQCGGKAAVWGPQVTWAPRFPKSAGVHCWGQDTDSGETLRRKHQRESLVQNLKIYTRLLWENDWGPCGQVIGDTIRQDWRVILAS